MQTKQATTRESGFTLVELAIVIVIIGLIIGGVLVGQDMIRSAEIRATIGQWEGYNSATNTFRDKYGYIPGDINQDRALEYGFFNRTGVAAAGNGDANGLLQACSATIAAGLLAGCETLSYWQDLNDAALVDGFFQRSSTAVATSVMTTEELPSAFPEAALGLGNYWTVFSAGGRNWFQLTGITAVANTGAYTMMNGLSPYIAFNIDRKVDDARPLTGGARAMSSTSALNVDAVPAAAAAEVCVESANNTYNMADEDDSNTPSCQLRFRVM